MGRSSRSSTRPRGIRRAERWLVGVAMAVVAFVLEKAVMRSVRKEDRPRPESAGTPLTSRGGEVEVDGDLHR